MDSQSFSDTLNIKTGRRFGVVCLGRAGMDLYPENPGQKLEETARFTTDLGGSSGNMAVAVARLGIAAGMITAVSEDGVGRFVRRFLEREGVDVDRVATVSGDYRTSLALAEVRPEDCGVVIYRNHAADFALTDSDVDARYIAEASILAVTGTTLARQPSRDTILAASRMARDHGTCVVFDMDYRPYSWRDQQEASRVYAEACEAADIVIGNDEEFAVLDGDATAEEAAAALLGANARLVIVKRGASGSTAYTRGGEPVTCGVFPVTAAKPYGAGDAFAGSLMAAILEGMSLEDALRRGSAAAAIVVARRGCASAMPNRAELDSFLSRNSLA